MSDGHPPVTRGLLVARSRSRSQSVSSDGVARVDRSSTAGGQHHRPERQVGRRLGVQSTHGRHDAVRGALTGAAMLQGRRQLPPTPAEPHTVGGQEYVQHTELQINNKTIIAVLK